MVDTADSKSAEGNLMPVRVRPPLPSKYPALSEVVLKPLKIKGFSFLLSYFYKVFELGNIFSTFNLQPQHLNS